MQNALDGRAIRGPGTECGGRLSSILSQLSEVGRFVEISGSRLCRFLKLVPRDPKPLDWAWTQNQLGLYACGVG